MQKKKNDQTVNCYLKEKKYKNLYTKDKAYKAL